jgi:diacylglycerol kinase
LGVYFDLNTSEWLNILIASCLVLFAEAINTSIEKLRDVYTRELNEQIKMVKDIAAGAVLIVVIFAIIVGGFVFYPHVKLLFH